MIGELYLQELEELAVLSNREHMSMMKYKYENNMDMKWMFFIVVFLIGYACSPKMPDGVKLSPAGKEVFGDKVTGKQIYSLEQVTLELADKDTVYTTVVADVQEVCQMKGCWMKISPSGKSSPEYMVRFKDYGFFVPKDISGDQMVLQGKAYRHVTDVATLRHYAEDAGKSAEEIAAITKPKEEFYFLAEGVELYRERK